MALVGLKFEFAFLATDGDDKSFLLFRLRIYNLLLSI